MLTTISHKKTKNKPLCR